MIKLLKRFFPFVIIKYIFYSNINLIYLKYSIEKLYLNVVFLII